MVGSEDPGAGRRRSARPGRLAALAAATCLLGVGGCGSAGGKAGAHARQAAREQARGPASAPGNPSPASGPTPRADLASVIVITGARRDGTVAQRYTCKGADISPPLLWGAVPATTKEVAVLVRTLTRGSIVTNWVVAGINPKTHRMRAGTTPPGAVVGRSSSGRARYSLCPPSGKPALVVFAVLALSRKLGLEPGFAQTAVTTLAGAPGVAWGSATVPARG